MKKHFIIFLAIILTSCYKPKNYLPSNVDIDQIIPSFYIANDSIPADGGSESEITIELPLDAVNEKSSVDLTISAGSFSENHEKKITKKIPVIDDNGINRRQLKLNITSGVSVEKEVIVEVNLLGYKKQLSLRYYRAYPTDIKIETDRLNIPAGFKKEVVFTAILKRSTGLASVGNIVDLEVQSELGSQKGYFRNYNNKSDATGKCTFNFTMGNDSTYTGKLYVIAHAFNGLTPVTKTITIFTNN